MNAWIAAEKGTIGEEETREFIERTLNADS